MGPLVIGLAAGALGFVLGGLGKKEEKKEQPAPPEPDPRLDQIMQSQAKQEALLGQILQNQQLMMSGMGACAGQSGGLGRDLSMFAAGAAAFGAGASAGGDAMLGCLQNPAALNALFSGASGPGDFLAMAERVVVRMPSGRC